MPSTDLRRLPLRSTGSAGRYDTVLGLRPLRASSSSTRRRALSASTCANAGVPPAATSLGCHRRPPNAATNWPYVSRWSLPLSVSAAMRTCSPSSASQLAGGPLSMRTGTGCPLASRSMLLVSTVVKLASPPAETSRTVPTIRTRSPTASSALPAPVTNRPCERRGSKPGCCTNRPAKPKRVSAMMMPSTSTTRPSYGLRLSFPCTSAIESGCAAPAAALQSNGANRPTKPNTTSGRRDIERLQRSGSNANAARKAARGNRKR